MKMCFLIQEKQQIDVGTENAAFEADEGLTKSDNLCPKYQVSTFEYFEFFSDLFFLNQNTGIFNILCRPSHFYIESKAFEADKGQKSQTPLLKMSSQ